MGYIYIPKGVSLGQIGFKCGLFTFLIILIIWTFYRLKYKLDLKKEIQYISNILAYSWLAISTFFLVTLGIYMTESARPHYLRISGVLSLISGIISTLYILFVILYDGVDE